LDYEIDDVVGVDVRSRDEMMIAIYVFWHVVVAPFPFLEDYV
jgi:hypothetical protein